MMSAFSREKLFMSGRRSFVRQLYVVIKFCRTEQRIKLSPISLSVLCVDFMSCIVFSASVLPETTVVRKEKYTSVSSEIVRIRTLKKSSGP